MLPKSANEMNEWKKLRKRLEITQTKMAILTGIPQNRISEIERGVHQPTKAKFV